MENNQIPSTYSIQCAFDLKLFMHFKLYDIICIDVSVNSFIKTFIDNFIINLYSCCWTFNRCCIITTFPLLI